MLKIEIGKKDYKLRFGYGVLSKTDLLKRVQEIGADMKRDDAFQRMLQTVSELFLAGAQKYHSDELGYDTDEEKQKQLDKVYDLLDTYEEESTEDNPQDGFILFAKMQEELMRNGFLSGLMRVSAEETAKKQDATILPTDHKKSARK